MKAEALTQALPNAWIKVQGNGSPAGTESLSDLTSSIWRSGHSLYLSVGYTSDMPQIQHLLSDDLAAFDMISEPDSNNTRHVQVVRLLWEEEILRKPILNSLFWQTGMEEIWFRRSNCD